MLMFALVISEDRISMQSRRADIISALHKLPEHIREVLDMDEQVVLCLLITLIVLSVF
jgi:glucosamine--fructose-6-phosphate aminotransferase (isomerizing)